MTDDQMINITRLLGTVERRCWIETRVEDGAIVYVGMGQRIDRDQAGNITSEKTDPTGLRAVLR